MVEAGFVPKPSGSRHGVLGHLTVSLLTPNLA